MSGAQNTEELSPRRLRASCINWTEFPETPRGRQETHGVLTCSLTPKRISEGGGTVAELSHNNKTIHQRRRSGTNEGRGGGDILE